MMQFDNYAEVATDDDDYSETFLGTLSAAQRVSCKRIDGLEELFVLELLDVAALLNLDPLWQWKEINAITLHLRYLKAPPTALPEELRELAQVPYSALVTLLTAHIEHASSATTVGN